MRNVNINLAFLAALAGGSTFWNFKDIESQRTSKGSTPNKYLPHTGAKQIAKAARRASGEPLVRVPRRVWVVMATTQLSKKPYPASLGLPKRIPMVNWMSKYIPRTNEFSVCLK